MQGLKDGLRAIFIEPAGSSDRVRAFARSVLQVTLVMLFFLLSTTVLDWSTGYLPGGSGRWVLGVVVASVYGFLYRYLLNAHTRSPVAWMSVGVFVCEVTLLACMFPYLLAAVVAITPKSVVRVLSEQGNDFFEFGAFLVLLLFSLKGWGRFVHRNAHIRMAAENADLYERMAMEDALTGLSNRRSFERTMAERLGTSDRRTALLMIDVDHFKQVNDKFSHEVGDQVLQGIAEVLRTLVGDAGVAARLAGDEFVVGLFGLEHDMESAMIGSLEVAMATYDWQRLAPGLTVTVSLGLARAEKGDSLADMLRRGDQQMYKYKRASRGATTEQMDPRVALGAGAG